MKTNSLIQHLDLLVGSIALDEKLKSAFMCNPVETIERFNREFVPRFHHRPIELLEDELKLVLALKADSWEEFVELVAIITTNCRGKVGTTLSTVHPCREGEVAIEYPF